VHRINWPPLILHVQSTMRMGVDGRLGLRRVNGEARAVKRLFIGDNSVLANGSAAQPDADDPGRGDPHGREDLPALLRR
jgi:hypothetical protein